MPAGKAKPPEEGAGWLTTFGDMVTLLFTFFVLVYSFSSFEPGKWETAVGAVRGALSVVPGTMGNRVVAGGGTGPFTGHTGVFPLFVTDLSGREARLAAVRERLGQLGSRGGTEGTGEGIQDVELVETRTGFKFRISTRFLFERGSAEVKKSAYELLQAIGEASAKGRATVTISGHTCDLPISSAEYPSNWELSARRATNVLRIISQNAGPDANFAALARAEFSPLCDNDTEEHRARNRRVEVLFDLEGALPYGN
jgi:chemotaxis protein MotB